MAARLICLITCTLCGSSEIADRESLQQAWVKYVMEICTVNLLDAVMLGRSYDSVTEAELLQ